MTAVEQYQELERKLKELRKRTGDADCPEEDAILDEMDPVWHAMTDDEKRTVDPMWGRGGKDDG